MLFGILLLLSTGLQYAEPLIFSGPTGMNDSQYLHLLLADEKLARIQLQNHVNDLETTVKDLKDRIVEIEETDRTQCGWEIQTVVSERFEPAASCPKTPTVAFMAQLSSNIVNRTQGRVVFDAVETNEGHAYSATQGIFTAPYNGTYNFNLVVSAPGHHTLHLNIKKNNIEVGYVFLDIMVGWWLRRGTDITIHVMKGDEVWVDMTAAPNTTLGGCCFHTHFSGFLIGTD